MCVCVCVCVWLCVCVCESVQPGPLGHEPLHPLFYFMIKCLCVFVCCSRKRLPRPAWSPASCSRGKTCRDIKRKKIKDRMSFTAISLIDRIDNFNPDVLFHFDPLPHFLHLISSPLLSPQSNLAHLKHLFFFLLYLSPAAFFFLSFSCFNCICPVSVFFSFVLLPAHFVFQGKRNHWTHFKMSPSWIGNVEADWQFTDWRSRGRKRMQRNRPPVRTPLRSGSCSVLCTWARWSCIKLPPGCNVSRYSLRLQMWMSRS